MKPTLTPKSNWKRLVIVSGITFGGTCISLFTILSIIIFFAGEDFAYNKLDTWLKVYLYLSIAVIITAIQIVMQLFLIIKDYQKEAGIRKESGDSLLYHLESAFEQERWTEVVKIGTSLSEALWYTGKFSLRIRIGELLEESARNCNNIYVRSEALLDDLGWSKHRMKMSGISEIKKGLMLAEENDFPYLISKGHRHLCHIEADSGHVDMALNHYKIAIENIERIEDKRKRQEMRGNVEYAHAKIYYAQSDYTKALKAIEISIAQYKLNNDLDREVKMYNFKGEILLNFENSDETALDAFQEGYKLALTISNNVNILRNAISISKIHKSRGNCKMAKQILTSVKKYLERMTDPVIIEEYNNLINSLKEIK